MTQRQPRMGTASLYLVPCGLVLLIDVFCWLRFHKFGCSGFVGLFCYHRNLFSTFWWKKEI